MPMNPEWLPVLALLLAGLFAGVVAARLFFTGDRGKATNLATAAIAMIVFAFALGQLPSKRIQVPEKPVPLTPAALSLPRTIGLDGEEADSTSASLVLGGVLLRVIADDRYLLSVDGRRFLELDSSPAGLRVTCDVADSNGQPAARIRENRFGSSLAYGVNLGGSNHILLLHKEGSVLFRIRYSTPRTIEVIGNMVPTGGKEPVLIKPEGGIHWRGGGIPPGATIDLRPQGKGAIDFQGSGLIRIQR